MCLNLQDLSRDFFDLNGLCRPLLIEDPEGLGIKIPRPFTVTEVLSHIGMPSFRWLYELAPVTGHMSRDRVLLGMVLLCYKVLTRSCDGPGEPDIAVEVIDVERQNSATGHWTLQRWVDYYNTPLADRSQILNVISLEFSKTPLSKLV